MPAARASHAALQKLEKKNKRKTPFINHTPKYNEEKQQRFVGIGKADFMEPRTVFRFQPWFFPLLHWKTQSDSPCKFARAEHVNTAISPHRARIWNRNTWSHKSRPKPMWLQKGDIWGRIHGWTVIGNFEPSEPRRDAVQLDTQMPPPPLPSLLLRGLGILSLVRSTDLLSCMVR